MSSYCLYRISTTENTHQNCPSPSCFVLSHFILPHAAQFLLIFSQILFSCILSRSILSNNFFHFSILPLYLSHLTLTQPTTTHFVSSRQVALHLVSIFATQPHLTFPQLSFKEVQYSSSTLPFLSSPNKRQNSQFLINKIYNSHLLTGQAVGGIKYPNIAYLLSNSLWLLMTSIRFGNPSL